MSAINERLKAIKMIGKLVGSTSGRKYLADNGYKSGQTIVAAQYDELIRDVMARIQTHEPPVTVALVRENDLFLMEVKPSEAKKQLTNANPRSTIGMLYEALKHSKGGSETFRITEWDSATVAVPMADVNKLIHA